MILDNESISRELEMMDKQSRAIKDELLRIVWYMRGGISYSEAHDLSHKEKETIRELIKENMETTKKSGLPFF